MVDSTIKVHNPGRNVYAPLTKVSEYPALIIKPSGDLFIVDNVLQGTIISPDKAKKLYKEHIKLAAFR